MNTMPMLTGHHRQLHRFAGRWAGEETIAATPWIAGGEAEARVEMHVGLGGFYVLQNYRQLRDGEERLSAHALLTWNAEADCVAMFWFDSIGHVPETPATGEWHGDTLVLTRSSRRGVARHTYELIGDNEYRVRLDFKTGEPESWMPVSSAVMRRV